MSYQLFLLHAVARKLSMETERTNPSVECG